MYIERTGIILSSEHMVKKQCNDASVMRAFKLEFTLRDSDPKITRTVAGCVDEHSVPVSDHYGKRIGYNYDFGDDWWRSTTPA